MKTILITDAYGMMKLVSLENVLSVGTGGGVYDAANTNIFVNYGYDQVVNWQVKEDVVKDLLLEIQRILERD